MLQQRKGRRGSGASSSRGLPSAATAPHPRRLHSPPHPQKCSAVASPSVPSPPPALDARRAARVRPELRELTGRGAETPAGNLRTRGLLFPSSAPRKRIPPPRPSEPPAPTRKPESVWCAQIMKPEETRIQPVGSAGEGRSAESDESAPKWSLEPTSRLGVVGCRPPPPGWSGSCFLLWTNTFFACREGKKLGTQRITGRDKSSSSNVGQPGWCL